MKRITLSKILHSLETLTYAVEIPEAVAAKARRSVERMLEIGRKSKMKVLVLGSGVAGLSAALGLAKTHHVTVLCKSELGWGASRWAQGGVAVALGADDSPALHARDTHEAGAGLTEREAVQVLTEEGPTRVRELIELGAHFDQNERGEVALGREAAHSRRRIVHSADTTGAELIRTLTAAVRRHPNITVVENFFASELLLENGRVVGVPGFPAAATVLATGGCGQLFRCTTNPPEATGDGLAMAGRAGARMRDLELTQFHPTALATNPENGALPLLTEAIRGEGAFLIDESGHRFMVHLHPDAELAPRDVVSRGLWAHAAAGHQTLLDARHIPNFSTRFPHVDATCKAHGLDPAVDPIPVSPAAHYHMGGVETDLWGRTSLPGLWACGEVASTGVHGANRLASNSLLEGLVFGARVAEDVARTELREPTVTADAEAGPWRWRETDPLLIEAVRELLWNRSGLVRDGAGLRAGLQRLARLRKRGRQPRGEAANMLLVAEWMLQGALARRESRGGHFRSDCALGPARGEHIAVEKVG